MATIVCGPEAQGSARLGRRTYRWEYGAWMGPLFVRADGTPLKRQPGENHPIWPVFQKWLEERGYLG